MDYIRVRKANCKNCYRCLKNCYVKSIKFKDEKVSVISDKCVLCGECIISCPQKAKHAQSDILKVMEFIKNPNIKTVVSLAPSFSSAFGKNSEKVVSLFKAFGFDEVEETAIGAAHVTKRYKELIEESKMDNIITSCCPTVNMYIKKYYPELTKYIAPVMSPAIAHGKLIKKKYGKDVKVIFAGPCLSKIKEIDENPEYADGTITFEQVMKWIKNEKISFDELDKTEFSAVSGFSRIYPIESGVIEDIKSISSLCREEGEGKYNFLSVSGLKDISRLLDDIQSGKVKNVFAEVNACRGGCVNGPLMPEGKEYSFADSINIKKYAVSANMINDYEKEDISAEYKSEHFDDAIPTDEEIQKILFQIGKYSKEQELNCGSCGYPTCRDKAIAVYQKKAELYMCLPYMSDMNQAMANVTLSVTPNYIIAVDEDMSIKEFNVAAQKLFKVSRNEVIGKALYEFIDTADFEEVIKNKKSIYAKKVKYDSLGISTSQDIIYVNERNLAIAIIYDITEEEQQKESVRMLKLESVDMAQKVIDKQMMVAQQIASLLGETTAETKVTLNKLKNLIASEETD